ncbi:DNA gyrase [Eggerthella lenta]|uniref:DNA gyrase n=1 Tax=Eggerthella lenta TaxID=84112 RepID=UPI001C109595|nr:DNA gyrase [Eggerthella lenta]MBU5399301.1 DNA gyrase [Eggerthella lenta]
MNDKKNVYLSFHKSFVKENIEYIDKATDETKTFNQVTLPKGTVIDGIDVSGYQFSPLYVNVSRYKGADWRDVPLLEDREVWLSKTFVDEQGQPLRDENGAVQKDIVKVLPAAIKDSLIEARRAWAASKEGERPLAQRAQEAREGARVSESVSAPRHDNQTR